MNQRTGWQKSVTESPWTSNLRNMILTATGAADDELSRCGEFSISVSPKESKLDDNSSSGESDQRLNLGTRSSEKSKTCSDKKPTKGKPSSKTVQAESGSHVKPVIVKPSPASLLLYTSPDPELSINVSGTKAELVSPRASSANKKDLPTRDLPTSGKGSSFKVLNSSQVSGSGAHSQPLQPEFIHFATGLISPSVQRRSRSAGNTNFAINKVKELNQREVSFDLSSPEETSVQNDACAKEFDSSPGEVLKRTNTPVSLEPPSSSSSPVQVPEETGTFAFSIPTADSDKGDRTINSVSGDKSPCLSEDKASVWGAQEVQSQTTPDSQFEAITALMRESLAVPNPSEYSSQTDSSESNQSGDNCDESMTTNFHKHRHSVRFENGTNFADSPDRANGDLPSRGQNPKVGDLLSSRLHPDVLDATVEVRRLRQQIRDDLVKQQEDTEDDIHYLRLRQSKRVN